MSDVKLTAEEQEVQDIKDMCPPGYVVDYIRPFFMGGEEEPGNMCYLPEERLEERHGMLEVLTEVALMEHYRAGGNITTFNWAAAMSFELDGYADEAFFVEHALLVECVRGES